MTPQRVPDNKTEQRIPGLGGAVENARRVTGCWDEILLK
jgi:hypothetical protein